MPLPKDKKLTMEDVEQMSTEEINDNWEDVKKVLMTSGQPTPAETDEGESDDTDE